MSTWYFSFCDPCKPKGQQFLGGCYVALDDNEAWPIPDFATGKGHDDLARAITKSHVLGINPGGEVESVGPLPDFPADYMAKWGHRLLTRKEIDEAPDPFPKHTKAAVDGLGQVG